MERKNTGLKIAVAGTAANLALWGSIEASNQIGLASEVQSFKNEILVTHLLLDGIVVIGLFKYFLDNSLTARLAKTGISKVKRRFKKQE